MAPLWAPASVHSPDAFPAVQQQKRRSVPEWSPMAKAALPPHFSDVRRLWGLPRAAVIDLPFTFARWLVYRTPGFCFRERRADGGHP